MKHQFMRHNFLATINNDALLLSASFPQSVEKLLNDAGRYVVQLQSPGGSSLRKLAASAFTKRMPPVVDGIGQNFIRHWSTYAEATCWFAGNWIDYREVYLTCCGFCSRSMKLEQSLRA